MGRSLCSSRGREWGGLYTHVEEGEWERSLCSSRGREWGGLYTHLEEGVGRSLCSSRGSGEGRSLYIDILHILHFIPKIIRFFLFFHTYYFPYDGQNGIRPMERKTNYSIAFS